MSDAEEHNQAKRNSSSPVLASLLGPDRLVIIALIVLTGGGNFWQSKIAQGSTEQQATWNREGINRAIEQINKLYEHVNEIDQRWETTDKRQKQALDALDRQEARAIELLDILSTQKSKQGSDPRQ